MGNREYWNAKDGHYLGPAHDAIPIRVDPDNPLDFGTPEIAVAAEEQQIGFDLVGNLNQLKADRIPRRPGARTRGSRPMNSRFACRRRCRKCSTSRTKPQETQELYGLDDRDDARLRHADARVRGGSSNAACGSSRCSTAAAGPQRTCPWTSSWSWVCSLRSTQCSSFSALPRFPPVAVASGVGRRVSAVWEGPAANRRLARHLFVLHTEPASARRRDPRRWCHRHDRGSQDRCLERFSTPTPTHPTALRARPDCGVVRVRRGVRDRRVHLR